jgi:outer membrane protein assembly factor BamB
MSVPEFVKKLEKSGLVDASAMAKIRRHIEDPSKKVRVKGILRFLVDKQYVTSKQAKGLLAEYEREDKELEVVGSKRGRDTNELIGLGSGPLSKNRNVNETTLDMDQPVPDQDDIEMPGQVAQGKALPTRPTHEQPMHDPFHDPFADHGAHYDNVEEVDEEDDEKSRRGFKAKLEKKNQWESKWLFIGGAILGLFVIVGAILAVVLTRTSAEDLYEAAYASYQQNRWSDAISKFERYIERHPNDKAIGKARVYRAHSRWRIPYESERWSDTITVLQTVLPEVEEEAAFKDVRDDLAVVLAGTALQIAEHALELDLSEIQSKEDHLKMVDKVTAIIENPAYVPTTIRRKPAIEGMLEEYKETAEEVNRHIVGEKLYIETLATINDSIDKGDTGSAFKAYYNFIGDYIEWKSREELQKAVASISEKERELVKPQELEVQVATEDVSATVDNSIVVAANNTATATPLLTGQTAAYLINGAVYGIDLAEGRVLWRRFVGFETTIQPLWVNENERQELIVADSRTNELMRIDGQTGNLIWRTMIGEPFAQPVVTISHIFVTTASGRVIKLMSDDGTTGHSIGGGPGYAAILPQPAIIGATVNDADPYVYQIGNYSNLYVLGTDQMECRDVYYLGHAPDSIRIPPVYVSGYLMIAQNTARGSFISVFRVVDDGKSIEKVKTDPIQFSGQMNSPMLKYNRFLIAVSDSGDLKMMDVNPTDEQKPVTVVANESFSADAELMVQRARFFMTARDGQLWISNPGIAAYKIRSSQNKVERQALKWTSSTFLGAALKYDDSLIVCRRRSDNPMATVSALDPATLDEKWRLDFGAPTAGPPIIENGRMFVVTSQGDSFAIDDKAKEQKTTTNRETVISKDVETYVFNDNLVLANGLYAFTSPVNRADILLIDRDSRMGSTASQLKPPANQPSCKPVKFGTSLLVPSRKGQVLRINPATGIPIGAAFQPPLSPGSEVNWFPPVVTEEASTFIIADAQGNFYRVVADGDQALRRTGELAIGKQLVSPIVQFKDMVVGVARDNDGHYLVGVSFDGDLLVAKTVELRAAYDAGPYSVEDKLLVGLENSEWLCFSNLDGGTEQTEGKSGDDTGAKDTQASGEQAQAAKASGEDWAIPFGAEHLADSPTMIDGKLVMVLRGGKIWFVNPANGNVDHRIDTRQPLTGSAILYEGQIVVGGEDGVLHFVDLPAL